MSRHFVLLWYEITRRGMGGFPTDDMSETLTVEFPKSIIIFIRKVFGQHFRLRFKWYGQLVPEWLQSEVGPKKAAILLTRPVHLSVGCQNLPIGNVPVITSHAAPVITSHAVPVITGTLPWSRERNVTKLYKVNFFCIIRQIFQPNNMVIWNYMGCPVKCCFIMNFVTLLA